MPAVLVIDDDVEWGAVVATALRADGHDVTVANDGVTGLQLALSGRHDLILLDLDLPTLPGESVLSAARAARAVAPVLVISGNPDVQTRVRCLDRGADDFVGKPASLQEICARVRVQLRRARRSAGEPWLHVRDLVLDPTRGRVVVDGRSIDLAGREYELLVYLARHAGRVCTREELLTAVWGFAGATVSNVVEVYIGRLRLKLGDNWIETVRGRGYALTA